VRQIARALACALLAAMGIACGQSSTVDQGQGYRAPSASGEPLAIVNAIEALQRAFDEHDYAGICTHLTRRARIQLGRTAHGRRNAAVAMLAACSG
jgi:hypothetical protein